MATHCISVRTAPEIELVHRKNSEGVYCALIHFHDFGLDSPSFAAFSMNIDRRYIKSEKSHKEKARKWLINHFHPMKRLPFLTWLPNYTLSKFKGDLISGVSVGLLLVPQSLAIAAVFGVPPINGFYSSLWGPLVSLFLSTSPDNSVGPTVLTAIVGARFNEFNSAAYTSIMGFFAGIVLILLSLMNAGVLMNFVSHTVLTSFITCGSISIIISQLPTIFGLVIEQAGKKSSYELMYRFFALITNTKYGDVIIGLGCIGVCLLCHYTMKYVTAARKRSSNKFKKVFWESVWLTYVSKNAFLTIVTTAIGYAMHKYVDQHDHIISLTNGELKPGFPKFQFPVLPTDVELANKSTVTKPVLEILGEIYPSFFLVPIMVFVETLALVKNFSRLKNYRADPTQELLSTGVANMVNSFFGGYPIGGALSRSSLNAISGVETSLSGIFTFIIVVLALMVLTPVFVYIPKAALAGMIVAAMIPSIDFSSLTLSWRVQKVELISWILTLLIGLYRLELGMIVGLGFSSAVILFREMRPRMHRIHHLKRGQGAFSIRFRSALHYPSAEFVSRRIMSFLQRFPELKELEVDCHAMHEIDTTVALSLLDIVNKLKNENQVDIYFLYVKQRSVKRIMVGVGLGPFIREKSTIPANLCLHCRHYHIHSHDANGNMGGCVHDDAAYNMEANKITTKSAPYKKLLRPFSGRPHVQFDHDLQPSFNELPAIHSTNPEELEKIQESIENKNENNDVVINTNLPDYETSSSSSSSSSTSRTVGSLYGIENEPDEGSTSSSTTQKQT